MNANITPKRHSTFYYRNGVCVYAHTSEEAEYREDDLPAIDVEFVELKEIEEACDE